MNWNRNRVLLLAMTMVLLWGIPGLSFAQTPSFDREVEFLIIGGGVAGLTGAIEAADLGCEDILLVEKLAYTGGSAFVSAGIIGGYETHTTKALDLHVDPKDMYDEQMREKRYALDPEQTWLTVEKSGETIDWLIDQVDFEFEPEVIVKDGYGTLQAIHIVEGGGPGMRAPYMKAIESRPAITIELDTKATELIVEDGVVVGAVIAKGETSQRVKAKAVLLATGGYSGNRELFTQLHPANAVFHRGAMPGYTGDGLIMATAIGAGMNNVDQLQCYLKEYEDDRSQTPYMYTVYVGKEGKRFMDEKRTPQTFNQDNRDTLIAQYGKDGWDYFWAINDHAAMAQFGLDENAKTHPGVVIADTLEELAEKTGVDADGLKESIAQWNEYAENENDPDFGRSRFWLPIAQAPYYAIKTTFAASVSHGGITKNEKAEVTRVDGSVIPGLYAAGEVAAVTNSNGYTISAAITFGRIAAQNALAYMNAE